MPYKTIIRLSGVARNPANGFPARPLGQFVHQGSGRGEAYRHSPLADGQGQSQRDVGPAAVVDGDNAIPVLEVFMAGQFDLLQE